MISGMKEILEIDHPIFDACRRGDATFVEEELRKGISVYARSPMNPPLEGYAISHNQLEVMNVLLRHGYNPNRTKNKIGETALMHAIGNQNVEMVKLLVLAGADSNCADNFGITPLMQAAGGDSNIVRILIESGAEVNAVGTQNFTAFYFAANEGLVEVMELLHTHGANVNVRNSDKETPLIRASRMGKSEAVEWLLDHGADINATDKRGKTALDWAKANGHQKVVELLQSRMG
jgi:ankyrin repeat protein